MESLRRLMSRKEEEPWKTVLNKWGLFLVCSHNSFLVQSEDWNPWRGWCNSWEWYEKSHSKTPKSGKEKAALWRQLHRAAKITSDKLDEAIAMRQELKKQNAELANLQQENSLLKARCKSLQEDLDYEQQQKIWNDQGHKQELENQRKLSQKENQVLQAKLQGSVTQCTDLEYQISSLKRQLEEEVEERQMAQKENMVLQAKLQKSVTQCFDLEYQISSLKSQFERQLSKRENKLLGDKKTEYQILDPNGEIVQVGEDIIVSQIHKYNIHQKNIIIVNYPFLKKFLEGGEGWHEKAKQPGVGCPSRSKIWKRLQRYEDPNVTLKNATYWRLVVQLSRYEDLGTKERYASRLF